MKMFTKEEWAEVEARLKEADRLEAIVNTPELIDFPKAVMLEAQHQEARWGTEDRQGKSPADWFRLVTNLSTRAIEHHKEADRLGRVVDEFRRINDSVVVAALEDQARHHREKAVHHTITTAAALNHWHASIIGKHTAMQPGYSAPAGEA